MLSGWFSTSTKQPYKYKFGVREITEALLPNLNDDEDPIIKDLSYHLLLAHGDPTMIKQECKILLEDLQDLGFNIIKKYIESQILPGNTDLRLAARIGNFGEILAARILIDSEDFWIPIYKLRFREKTSWAMKLTDLCLIKKDDQGKPLICYGEVKTKSSMTCDTQLGIKGHDSLAKDDALQDPEILKFICTILYTMQKFDEANYLSKMRLGKVDYDKQHCLFIIHEKSTWNEKILADLNNHNLSPYLINFSVNVVLINQLRKVIDESYSRAWKCVDGI